MGELQGPPTASTEVGISGEEPLPVWLGKLASEHLGVESTTAQKGLGFPFKTQRDKDKQYVRGSKGRGTKPCICLLQLQASSILPCEREESSDAWVSRWVCSAVIPRPKIPLYPSFISSIFRLKFQLSSCQIRSDFFAWFITSC